MTSEVERFFSEQSPLATEVASFRPRAQQRDMAMAVAEASTVQTALTAAQVHVAITHQVGAVVLWVLVIRARHLAQYPVAGSIREGTA